MASIIGVGTELPEFEYSIADVHQVVDQWLALQPDKLTLFNKFLSSARTNTRRFIVPPSEILALGGMERRAEFFEECAPALGAAALSKALASCDLSAQRIESLIFTSCSCPVIPSVDGVIIDRLGIGRTINRYPIYQHGCAGGVVGLKLAAEQSRIYSIVALTSVELCSLVFHTERPTNAELVGAAIFADGAASAIISSEDNGLVIRAAESYLIPQSRHLMGYDILDDGHHLLLDRSLPQALVTIAPERITSFLHRHNIRRDEVAAWLFHPGSWKILDFLENSLEISGERAHWARGVLNEMGNVSSATVLFVLQRYIQSQDYKSGDKVVMVGVGPGLTLELLLFEWVI